MSVVTRKHLPRPLLPVQLRYSCAKSLASTAAMDLADVPNDAMLREMQRRLDCLTRPEKRVILVGARVSYVLCAALVGCLLS